MTSDVKNSINLLSHIHSQSSDFLQKKLAEKGFENFASSHGNILFQLSVNEKMTMGDLAEKINRDKSTTTVLVRKLEAAGFLTGSSDPSDKRSRIIFLTPKGKQFNKTAKALSEELLSTFYKDFTDEEKSTFLRLLLKIQNNFKE